MTETRITDDGVSLAHTSGDQSDAPERKEYTVVSEAGLFKNGKQYDAGDQVELDEKTAQNFIENGDIK